jgi:ethanolamine ammonia-lyase small subunit
VNAGATACCCTAPPATATVPATPGPGAALSDDSAQRLREHAQANPGGVDLAIVVADGLSALAVHRHTLPFLSASRNRPPPTAGPAPVVLVEQGRVAVADEVGELLGADGGDADRRAPGLSSPDSLGCISPTRPRSA